MIPRSSTGRCHAHRAGLLGSDQKEAKALRDYLLKGGFLIADDFTFFDCTPEHCELAIERFEKWMQKVMPKDGSARSMSSTRCWTKSRRSAARARRW